MRTESPIMKMVIAELTFLLLLFSVLVVCTCQVYGEMISSGWMNVLMEGFVVIVCIAVVILMIKGLFSSSES